jgi:hypothetical protein
MGLPEKQQQLSLLYYAKKRWKFRVGSANFEYGNFENVNFKMKGTKNNGLTEKLNGKMILKM